MAETVFKAIEDLCSSGMSVLLAEQDLHWVTAFAARAFMLETGRIVDIKRLSDVRQSCSTSAGAVGQAGEIP